MVTGRQSLVTSANSDVDFLKGKQESVSFIFLVTLSHSFCRLQFCSHPLMRTKSLARNEERVSGTESATEVMSRTDFSC